MCVQTKEVIMEFADAKVPPHELARVVCAAAIWVGGSKNGGRPLIIWESQGPGWDFGRQIMKTYEYPRIYFDRATRTLAEKRTNRGGWHSTNEKKELMLGGLRKAYALGGIMHHSEEAIGEATTYIYLDGGGIGPAGLMEESANARKTHGDRVISVGLAVMGVEEAGGGRRPQVAITAPSRSPAFRRQLRLRQKNADRRMAGRTFDWRT